MIIHNPILTGSFTVNGTDVASITSSAASITAINSYTASQNILNGTYATTGSNTFKNPQTINSNLTVTGSITAATLVVQTITSSVVYSSGSNVFGNNIANTQVFTGSLLVTGSATFASSIQSNNTLDNYAFKISPTGSDLWGMYANISSSFVIRKIGTADYLTINPSGSVGIGTSSPSTTLDVNGATKITGGGNTLTLAKSGNYPALAFQGATYTNVIESGDDYMDFYTSGSRRMRITSGGNVGIGNTGDSAYRLIVTGADTGTSNWTFLAQNSVGTVGLRVRNDGLVLIPGTLSVSSRGITQGSMPAGSVIQVVSYKLTSGFSTTSASDQDTGLKVSITPTSSTSKILVLVSANARAVQSSGNCYINMKLVRGAYDTGVALHNGYAVMGNYNSTDIRGSVSYSYLDSPATTSSTQYVVTINSTYAGTVYLDSTTTPSTITLMEIAQ